MKIENNKENELKLHTLDSSVLKTGDIILTTSKDKLSNAIKIITLGSFSHAMLYLGDDSCADAGGPGIRVTSHNIQRIFFESPKHCAVLRLKQAVPRHVMGLIIMNARRFIGMEYSLSEAKLVALRAKFEAKEINRQFCSRYVAQAYESVGLKIVDNADYCSPVDIYNSKELFKIENHLRIASEEEIELLNRPSKSLSHNEDATDYIITQAKELTGLDIQTFEQFNGWLIKIPSLDQKFAEIVKESDFLNSWQIEKNENPWFYDFRLLKEKFPDSEFLKYFGNERLVKEFEIRKRFDITIQTLKTAYQSSNLRTLKLQIDLYETLIDLSKTRETVWNKAIQQ